MKATPSARERQVRIPSDSIELEGILAVPENATGIVLFAHGSGSSRLSPRNLRVARELHRAGIGTLLFDLLTEPEAENRNNVFDVKFLAHRLADATRYLRSREDTAKYPLAYFGASTGAAAALIAAADDLSIRAIVSRGGRPDLAMNCLGAVSAPTLLIVGGDDEPVIGMNRQAYEHLRCEKRMAIVPGATHLFEEPGTLEKVIELATEWFVRHLKAQPASAAAADRSNAEVFFTDRAEAGRRLAARLMKYRRQDPVVVALPRGGVPVAAEVARALDAPLEVMVARKLGAPGEPELGIGALVDGDHPESVLNEEVVAHLRVSREYLSREVKKQLDEIRRREQVFRGGRPRVPLQGRTLILIDDGIATGASIRAALRGIRRANPRRIILAVPVAPAETLEELRHEADEVVCLGTPELFYAIGQFYRDFHQLEDSEVVKILDQARMRHGRGEAQHDHPSGS